MLQKPSAKVQNDIKELQKGIQILESNRRSAADASQGEIRKQRVEIMKLQVEQRALRKGVDDMKLIQAGGSGNKSNVEVLDINKQRFKAMGVRFERESQRSVELQRSLDQLIGNLEDTRADLTRRGGLEVASALQSVARKHIVIMEGRLDNALQRYNSTLVVNRQLKQQIEVERYERTIYEGIIKKTEDDINAKKKSISDEIELCNSYYANREVTISHMARLKNKADLEFSDFSKQWSELQKMIQVDERLVDFMDKKERRTFDLKLSSMSSGATPQKALDVNSLAKVKNHLKELHLTCTKLQEATGITSMEDLIQRFLDADALFFALYTASKANTDEAGRVQAQADALSRQVDNLKGTLLSPTDEAKRSELHVLESHAKLALSKLEKCESSLAEATDKLSTMSVAVHSLAKSIDCDKVLLDELGIMSILSDVETRVQRMLDTHYIECATQEINLTVQPSEVPVAEAHVPTLPSSVDDESDVEEDRILSREELHQKIAECVNRPKKAVRRQQVAKIRKNISHR